MKATPKQRKEVVDLLEKWRPRLLLGEWFFEIVYSEKPLDGGGYECLAETHVDPIYLKSVITIHPAFLKAPADVRERAMVHELCHCVTEEMKRLSEDQSNGILVTHSQFNAVWERLTQRVTNVAMGGYDDLVERRERS